MSILKDLPVDRFENSWRLIAAFCALTAAFVVFVFIGEIDMWLSDDLPQVERLLEERKGLLPEYGLISEIIPEANLPENHRSGGAGLIELVTRERSLPNWETNSEGGYFTFKVRGYKGPMLTRRYSSHIKVFYEKEDGRVTRISEIVKLDSYYQYEKLDN